MARKRGGLAGLYDRNKGVIQAAAPFIAGAVGGPLAGAAIGAAMKGLDREGKSGIGLDLGKAAMGGISGYGAGAMGQSVAGGLGNLRGRLAEKLFTGDAAKSAAEGAARIQVPTVNLADKAFDIPMTPSATSKGVFSGAFGSAPDFNAQQYLSEAASQGPSRAMTLGKGVSTKTPTSVPSRAGSLLSRAAAFAEKNPKAIGEAAKLAMAAAGPDNEGRKLALMEQQYEDEQAASGRRAQIAAQLLTGGGAFGRAEPSVVGARYTSMNNRLYGTAPGTYAFDPEEEARNRQFAASMRGAGPMGFPSRQFAASMRGTGPMGFPR